MKPSVGICAELAKKLKSYSDEAASIAADPVAEPCPVCSEDRARNIASIKRSMARWGCLDD